MLIKLLLFLFEVSLTLAQIGVGQLDFLVQLNKFLVSFD